MGIVKKNNHWPHTLVFHRVNMRVPLSYLLTTQFWPPCFLYEFDCFLPDLFWFFFGVNVKIFYFVCFSQRSKYDLSYYISNMFLFPCVLVVLLGQVTTKKRWIKSLRVYHKIKWFYFKLLIWEWYKYVKFCINRKKVMF